MATVPRTKPKVLVADDEPAIANYIVKILDLDGYETAVEYSGAGAVRRAASFRPHIALIGFVMPGMGGVEAGISLLKVSPKTKIVLITEPVPFETLENLEARGYHFWTLPAIFSREELRSVILGWSWE
jgi:two-component system response regulator MtrA